MSNEWHNRREKMNFDELNDEQKEAIKDCNLSGPLLILAGAGSGKTKTITARLACLILKFGIEPKSILTLTFTNKAANEMRDRALNLLRDTKLDSMPLLCTFHKFGLLFLRKYINELGRKSNFNIIDTDDKKKIIKSISDIEYPQQIASEISRFKNRLISPRVAQELAQNSVNENAKKTALIYEKYEQRLFIENLVDFDDLIALPYQILNTNSALCDQISQQYAFIMVDEYQDTNDLQFKLLQKLCAKHDNLCVVGDDDQSIYGWRGAKIANILEFDKHFPNAKVIKLTKNYRSTAHILNAANELIKHNRLRRGKDLVPIKQKGEEIEIYSFDDMSFEANKIAIKIKNLIESGVNPSEIAILYRINALSRGIEEGLSRAGIAYKMVGGQKFYERAEIKDVIAYLRLILYNGDDFSLKRVINRPKRGIGDISFQKIENLARSEKKTLFETISNLNSGIIGAKALDEVNKFCVSISELANLSVNEILDEFEAKFGLKAYYEAQEDGDDRVANIDEFMASLRENAKDDEFDLNMFLNDLSLQSEQDNISQNMLSLMSIHASKGLEFDYVFVVGLEEGTFPLLGENYDIEEERRIAYVAITRAKKSLILSTCETRFLHGRKEQLKKSRFLSEAGLSEAPLQLTKTNSIKKGDLINHKLFGFGRVTSVSPTTNDLKLKINFGGIERQILASFITKVE